VTPLAPESDAFALRLSITSDTGPAMALAPELATGNLRV
jgi:hypothetical protein